MAVVPLGDALEAPPLCRLDRAGSLVGDLGDLSDGESTEDSKADDLALVGRENFKGGAHPTSPDYSRVLGG